MFPDFGAMQEGLGAIIALVERGVSALEQIGSSIRIIAHESTRIANHLDELHADYHGQHGRDGHE